MVNNNIHLLRKESILLTYCYITENYCFWCSKSHL